MHDVARPIAQNDHRPAGTDGAQVSQKTTEPNAAVVHHVAVRKQVPDVDRKYGPQIWAMVSASFAAPTPRCGLSLSLGMRVLSIISEVTLHLR